MKQTLRTLFAVLTLLTLGTAMSWAAFADFSAVLNNQDGTLLTADEQVQGTAVNFGINAASQRVAADDADAVAVVSGKYHSDHGCTGLTVTVPVDGGVKITVGQCTFSGSAINVKDSQGNTVATKTPASPSCWKNNQAAVDEIYYTGGAETLTISGMGYCPYIAVEKNENPVVRYDVAFTAGSDADVQGVAPKAIQWTQGDAAVAVPANRTLYKEGYTLTSWTDGSNTYAAGDTFTPAANVTLAPQFTANTKTLADRTEPTTIKWDFAPANGAPELNYQNKAGILVAQAQVAGTTVDVPMSFTTSNGGKINNVGRQNEAQVNNGTTFTIPSAQGAQVTIDAFAAMSATTIDGQADYTAGTTITADVASKAATIDIVVADGSYYHYITTVLPVPQTSAAGKTYTNEAASVVFAMSDKDNTGAYTATPTDGFSTVAFDSGDCTITGTIGITDGQAQATGVTGIKFKPAGTTKSLAWQVRPAAGLTLTPTKVSGYVNRCGTDAKDGIVLTAQKSGGDVVSLGTFTALRQGKTSAQTDYDATAVYKYEVTLTADQQAALAGADGFTLTSAVGVGAAKEGAFGKVTIEGLLNGTVADVAKYTIAVAAEPAAGGTVKAYPATDEYYDGDKVKLTAEEQFGYDFVNWTAQDGTVLSTDPVFTYTVAGADLNAVANFQQVATYELATTVAKPGNDYMVSLSPAPTMVGGKQMYEAGTRVTVTAAENPIMTFTGWSDGQTGKEITVDMTEDRALTASYEAVDFIAAWDFILAGGNGRPADFAAADNDADQLQLTDGTATQGWLDKSQRAAGGYEGRPAAVNWRTDGLGKWYWQTKVNAAAFTNIKVKTAMLYNYNAYTTYLLQYSTDGTNWETAETIAMQGAKSWTDIDATLPAACDNKSELYLRWIADTNSSVDGTTSNNDGATLGATYITGTAQLVDDPVPPAVVSTLPAAGATTASASGKIVLTFDKKVQAVQGATATLGTQTLAPVATGKTVAFAYKGLAYDTDYTFTLPAGAIENLTGHATTEAITIAFHTMQKTKVQKQQYDFVVGRDGTVTEAIKLANANNGANRYRIFFPNGKYVTTPGGKVTGDDGDTYDDPKTTLAVSNVSFIGQSTDGVEITNTLPARKSYICQSEGPDKGKQVDRCPLEGIRTSGVLYIAKDKENTYFQNLTIKSSMGDANGRDIELCDAGKRTIVKDACLWGYQDTYVSDNAKGKFYFEGGVIRGRTDYMCGSGDVFYNGVTLQSCDVGGYIAVPSGAYKYGYIYNNCYIKLEDPDAGSFTLGRPWGKGTPIALYLNTVMDKAPNGDGWSEMSGGWPKQFAEYNSTLTTGTTLDLSGRKTTFADTHTNVPVLTEAEAAQYTIATVCGQDDDWDPTLYTEQAAAPTNVELARDTQTITWAADDYALLWAVFKDGVFVADVIEPSYKVSDMTATYTVRAANEMGGLGEEATAKVVDKATAIAGVAAPAAAAQGKAYNTAGQAVGQNYKGIVVKNGAKYAK